MKFARIIKESKISYGIVDKNSIALIVGLPYENQVRTGVSHSLDEVVFLPPCEPKKIIAVGLNYTDHAEELGMEIPDEPLIFLKAVSSLAAHQSVIKMPPQSERIDYEGELAVIIERECKDIDETEADEYIFGYTCANDVTARDLQKKDGQWARAKSFDGFCPVGPIVTEKIEKNAKIVTYLDEEMVQESDLAQRIFSDEYLVSFISKIMTLSAGDIILTGTPPGVGEIKNNSKVKVEIDGIGILENRFIK